MMWPTEGAMPAQRAAAARAVRIRLVRVLAQNPSACVSSSTRYPPLRCASLRIGADRRHFAAARAVAVGDDDRFDALTRGVVDQPFERGRIVMRKRPNACAHRPGAVGAPARDGIGCRVAQDHGVALPEYREQIPEEMQRRGQQRARLATLQPRQIRRDRVRVGRLTQGRRPAERERLPVTERVARVPQPQIERRREVDHRSALRAAAAPSGGA